MMELTVFALVFLMVIVFVLWIGLKRLVPHHSVQTDANLPVDHLLPTTHLRHASDLERVLAEVDQEGRRGTSSRRDRQILTAARRRVLRELLAGLREDFSRLDRLMCTVASLSPEVDRRQETERLSLWFRFRLHYYLAWLNLTIGRFSQPDLTSICKLFDRLAARTQAALDTVEQNSLTPLRSRLSA